MILDNSTYNKVKLLHQISKIIWFIDKHALEDSSKAGDAKCIEILREMKKDMEKSLEKLQQSVCIISQ